MEITSKDLHNYRKKAERKNAHQNNAMSSTRVGSLRCACAALLTLLGALFVTTACVAQEKNPDASQQSNLGPRVQTSDPMEIQPRGPKPDWAPTIDPQMLAVIEQFTATEPPAPATQLSAFQFRNIVLPAEAAAAVLKKAGIPQQEPKTDISHRLLPVGPEEGILVRIYTPLSAQKPAPVIVYYHGGGWVIADLSGLPPTTIINAEIDPLRAEGGELAERMKAADIDVVREVYPGVTHEFFGMASLLEQAMQAQELAAERLSESF